MDTAALLQPPSARKDECRDGIAVYCIVLACQDRALRCLKEFLRMKGWMKRIGQQKSAVMLREEQAPDNFTVDLQDKS